MKILTRDSSRGCVFRVQGASRVNAENLKLLVATIQTMYDEANASYTIGDNTSFTVTYIFRIRDLTKERRATIQQGVEQLIKRRFG